VGNELGFQWGGRVECGQQAAAAYIQRFTMVGSNGRNQLGFQIGRLPIQMPCRCRARPLSRAVLVLAHGPNSRPRHEHGDGPCQARARGHAGRAVLGPCFLGLCPCRPTVPGPSGKLYTQPSKALYWYQIQAHYTPRRLDLVDFKTTHSSYMLTCTSQFTHNV
jgi:hypothetical protein